MHNSRKQLFSLLSVSTGNRLTSDYEKVCETKIGYERVYKTDYERVYETVIGYSILLTTTGFHRHLACGAKQVFSPNSTQPTSSGRKGSGAHRQLAFSIS